MEELEYSLENEEQFWAELDDIVAAQCETHELIDNALRSYLLFTTKFRDEYLNSEYELARCSEKLLQSKLFKDHQDYVRRQIVYCLLQEDEAAALHIIAGFLLFDGRQHEMIWGMMNEEGAFGRLLELITRGTGEDAILHRSWLELLYEMCRVHRLKKEDLSLVDDEFVKYLFQIIEQLSNDADDPYHYPVIRVLLVLNEQYMVASASSQPSAGSPLPPLTNRVVKILSIDGPSYMTFGENIILLLNRETETSLQLLILKLLYLLFTTEATQEYFYTNDLRVLLDVIIRNLLDLPDNLVSLRHTYLRVFYPLLAFTQLCEPPHYKKHEITKVLSILGGSSNTHFAPTDETTLRLVERVAQVSWLRDEEITPSEVAKRMLGMSLSNTQGASTVSVVDITAVMEKPGVKTPSRKDDNVDESSEDGDKSPGSTDGVVGISSIKKTPPIPPPLRLSSRHHSKGGHGDGKNNHKKLPPKAPPRRRTKRLLEPTNSSI